MKAYALGYNGTEKKPVIVTIGILEKTDMKDLKRRPKNYKMPFFQRHLINCGKIEIITSIDEKTRYDSANIYVGSQLTTVHRDKFFYISDYNYSTGAGIMVYPYKYCIVNLIKDFVGSNYTGTIMKFYEGGNLYKRIRYYKGDLTNERIYSNNDYNTLLAYVRYTSGNLVYASHFDEQENQIGEAKYGEDRQAYDIVDLPPPSYILELTEISSYTESYEDDLPDGNEAKEGDKAEDDPVEGDGEVVAAVEGDEGAGEDDDNVGGGLRRKIPNLIEDL